VWKIVLGLRRGTILPRAEKEALQEKRKQEEQNAFMIWKDGEDEDERDSKGPMHIPAPKMPLPGHAASYRPPDEYLFTEEEKEAWLNADPEDRELDFIPQKFDSLRQVRAFLLSLIKRRSRHWTHRRVWCRWERTKISCASDSTAVWTCTSARDRSNAS
jgi:ribosome biogenesis protein ERB1